MGVTFLLCAADILDLSAPNNGSFAYYYWLEFSIIAFLKSLSNPLNSIEGRKKLVKPPLGSLCVKVKGCQAYVQVAEVIFNIN